MFSLYNYIKQKKLIFDQLEWQMFGLMLDFLSIDMSFGLLFQLYDELNRYL